MLCTKNYNEVQLSNEELFILKVISRKNILFCKSNDVLKFFNFIFFTEASYNSELGIWKFSVWKVISRKKWFLSPFGEIFAQSKQVFVLFEIFELFEYFAKKYSIFELQLFLLESETLDLILQPFFFCYRYVFLTISQKYPSKLKMVFI